MKRSLVWFLIIGSLLFVVGLKAIQFGWFAARPPLEFNGEAAILFFNKARGCECERFVYDNARAQMQSWQAPIQVIQIDLDRRPDLAREFGVIRAPTLILVSAQGDILWKQDVGIRDEAPLDLESLQQVIEERIAGKIQ